MTLDIHNTARTAEFLHNLRKIESPLVLEAAKSIIEDIRKGLRDPMTQSAIQTTAVNLVYEGDFPPRTPSVTETTTQATAPEESVS